MTDTLKSICEQCTHLHHPQLDFLPAEPRRHREIILRDIRELVSAASAESEKTVLILTGCLFESILFAFIQAQTTYISARRGTPFALNPEHGLKNYISIFNAWFAEIDSVPDVVGDYRDTVHINRELQYPPDFCRRAASDMLRLLDVLIGRLGESFGI
jgi:hypothetical protein